MKQYEAYKDSGIQWLGEIPSHWDISKLKHVASCNDEVLAENTDPNLLINYVEISDVDSIDGVKCATQYSFKEAPSRARRVTRTGDIIISTVRTYLKAIAAINENDLIVSTGFAVIRSHKINSSFLKYSLLNEGFIDEVIAKSVGVSYPAITSTELMGIEVILPPFAEQEVIAAYLDQKVGKIDAILSEKEAMVEQLQQYRKSLISETVTRGLDPNVPMKDSGIDWIGQIPAHWVMVKLKYISNLQSGSNLTSEQIEETGEYPVFGGNGLRGYYHDFNTEGDRVLIGRQGALCGNINYASGKFWATEHAVVCHPIKQYNVMWLGSLLEIMNLNQYSIASAQPGLSVDRIKQLEIPLPPFDEQQEIGSFIEKKDLDIRRSISELQSQIEDLKAYKSSVITEAVTGKVDLRNWKPSEVTA